MSIPEYIGRMKLTTFLWNLLVGYLMVTFIIVSLPYWNHDSREAGFMKYAPRWEPHKFPILTCLPPEQSAGYSDLLRPVVTGINTRLGFRAFDVELPRVYTPNRPCTVIVDLGDAYDTNWCPKDRGWTTFSYRVEQYDEPGLVSDEGTGQTVVGMCNAPTLALRTLALRHQLGHVLGLADDVGLPNSVMNPLLLIPNTGNARAQITDFDRSLIRERYAP